MKNLVAERSARVEGGWLLVNVVNVISTQVSVVKETMITWQQIITYISIVPKLKDKCTKYQVNRPSNCKVIELCLCCHGSKVTMAIKQYMYF